MKEHLHDASESFSRCSARMSRVRSQCSHKHVLQPRRLAAPKAFKLTKSTIHNIAQMASTRATANFRKLVCGGGTDPRLLDLGKTLIVGKSWYLNTLFNS